MITTMLTGLYDAGSTFSTYASTKEGAMTTIKLTTETDNAMSSASYPSDWSWMPVSWTWWEILQLILAVIGIVGNFLVMLVLFHPRRKRRSTDSLIAALAVADFLTSVFIVPYGHASTLPDTTPGEIYCRVAFSSVLMWISICASIFTLTTISVERLLAIRYPFAFQRIFTPKRSALAVVFIWLFAAFINTFSFFITYVEDNACIVRFPSTQIQKFIGISLFLIEYFFPVIVMVSAHVLTIHSLRHRKQTLATGQEGQKHAQKLLVARRRVIEMLFIVVVMFIICWTPDQFGFLAFNLGLVDPSHLYGTLYRCLVVLSFANSCVNPIIYSLRNQKFRRALKELCGVGLDRRMHSVFGGVEDSSLQTAVTTAPVDDQTKV